MSKIEIRKVDLVEGEELQGLIRKVFDALRLHKTKSKGSFMLKGIFKDFIITQDSESGKFFRMKMSRDANQINLDGLEEVRQTFVPVTQKTEKSEEVRGKYIAMDDGEVITWPLTKSETISLGEFFSSDESEMVEVEKESIWKGFLD